MQHTDNPEYVILSPEKGESGKGGQALDHFFSELTEKISKFKNDNLILDFSQVVHADVTKILLFSQLSGKHKDQNKSFVIVSEGINLDEVPDELVIVPTVQEAIDIIEIENIERDLGF